MKGQKTNILAHKKNLAFAISAVRFHPIVKYADYTNLIPSIICCTNDGDQVEEDFTNGHPPKHLKFFFLVFSKKN